VKRRKIFGISVQNPGGKYLEIKGLNVEVDLSGGIVDFLINHSGCSYGRYY